MTRIFPLSLADAYALAAFFFGAFFLIVTPPFGTGDETAHFERAYEIAAGRFLGAEGLPAVQRQRLAANNRATPMESVAAAVSLPESQGTPSGALRRSSESINMSAPGAANQRQPPFVSTRSVTAGIAAT